MIEWFRWWHENIADRNIKHLSINAMFVATIAHEIAIKNKTSYPNWWDIEKASKLGRDEFMEVFEELENLKIVSPYFPSILTALHEIWPLPPMFGPINNRRPSAEVWKKIRITIFQRDNYTCKYCGERVKKLECDHVVPVSRGGTHEDSNLVTACFKCNRSKRDKLLEEWLQ